LCGIILEVLRNSLSAATIPTGESHECSTRNPNG
jgi:hypothetical protein